MAINISSDSVEVYPSTRRDISYQISSRSFNEKNIVSTLKRAVENPSFVISDKFNGNSSFEFVINGYYFKVNPASNILNAFNNIDQIDSIYAYILIDSGNNIEELWGIDDNSTMLYTGLNFQATQPTESLHYIKILQKDPGSSSWSIPAQSKLKFSRKVIDLDVDGGVIL